MKLSLTLCICVLSASLQAENWFPKKNDANKPFRLLECRYNKATLENVQEIGEQSKMWSVKTSCERNDKCENYTFVFRAKQPLTSAGVAVSFDCYGWSSDNYVMIPASVYNGNRQRIVYRQYAQGLDNSERYRKDLALTSNPIPQLSPEFGAQSRLEVNVSNSATPAITYLERQQKRGVILLTDQGLTRNNEIIDHTFIVEESPDRSVASFVIAAPGVRERKPEFIGFSESPDRGLSFNTGDEIVIRVKRYTAETQNIPDLLRDFHHVRKSLTGENSPRLLMPSSHILSLMAANIDKRYLVCNDWSFYCPENANWISFGWIGGLMNTYPMLALGDDEHLARVKNTFDFAIPRAQAETGYFYSTLGEDGKVFGRDGSAKAPEVILTRQNADVLYWMIKQFMLLRDQQRESTISPDWETNIRRQADAFVQTWKKNGSWGNFINIKTGDIAVYNTTSGAMAIAGLALAADYYNHPEYLSVAIEAADFYYDSFALLGFTSGGCGDILQNADSETAIALLTSLYTLYEYTGNEIWLQRAIHLADLCATWTVSFDYQLPANTPLAKLGAKLTGAVWASTQNKHGAPGFCTSSGDAIFKIYRSTLDTLYANQIRDVIRAHAEGIQPNGQITERLTYCDADSRGSRGDGGKTGWNETNGALMALEIPGIYIRTDRELFYVFDHVTARIKKSTPKEWTLSITNPTAFDAVISVLEEDAASAKIPLKCNAFLKWKKVKVAAGKTIDYKIRR